MKNKVSQFNPQPLKLMDISINKQVSHSFFGWAIYSALTNCRPATRRKFNGRVLRDGNGAILELAVIDGFSPLKSSIDDICKNLRSEGIQVDGVDGWNMRNGKGTGVSFVLSMDGAFKDIDEKAETEAING